MQIGASKYVQYGNVEIDHIEATETKVEIIPAGTEVMCTLISPVVLLNERNESLVTTKDLESKLPLQEVTAYLDQTVIGGYNSKWMLQKPSYTAYKAGSCLKGKLTKDTPASFVLGSLVQEGNGMIILDPITEIKKQDINKVYTYETKRTKQPKYLKNILLTSIKGNMKLDLLKKYKEKYEKILKEKQKRNLSVKEEEELMDIFRILKAYREVDEVPAEMLKSSFSGQIDLVLNQLDTLLKK